MVPEGCLQSPPAIRACESQSRSSYHLQALIGFQGQPVPQQAGVESPGCPLRRRRTEQGRSGTTFRNHSIALYRPAASKTPTPKRISSPATGWFYSPSQVRGRCDQTCPETPLQRGVKIAFPIHTNPANLIYTSGKMAVYFVDSV